MSNNPTDSGDSYSDPGKTQGSIIYVLGVSVALIVLIIIVFYVSYKCRRNIRFGLPPADPEDDHEDQQPMRLSDGLDEDVLMTFPSYVYSDDMMMMPHNSSSHDDDTNNTHGSGNCSICLADYKPSVDVVRLLPKCDHLFHRKCIDTWLRVHPTCPVCRNSPLPDRLANMTRPLSHSVLDIRLDG
uniref:RING-H2 finger protein ATL70-like n=1 Tax=Erigeron canadensis TaxID=72917 RepID=UPI001CB8C464|nr:RING-H2 finger protein ATL70-like [Erigeron canadensis]